MIDTRKFKTKTMIVQRNNGDAGDVWPVALDIGYSAVKIFSPNIVAMFPSFAKREDGDIMSSVIGSLPDSVITYRGENGECWAVGEDAQERIDVKDTNDTEAALYSRERYMSPMFRVILETGIGMAMFRSKYGSPDGKKIVIQTGLPPKYIKSDAELMRDAVAGHHAFSLRVGSREEVKFDFTIDRQDVYIMPQPMGTLYSVTIGQDRKPLPSAASLLKKNIVVFDPGFGTLDIFPIRQQRIGRSETFDNLGMKRVIQETAKQVNEKYHQDISVPAMQKYLGKGTVRIVSRQNGRMMTKDIEFGDLLSDANERVCMEAVQKLEQVLPLEEFDCLIITGGTSAAWNKMIREYFAGMSTLQIIEGNVNDTLPFAFANVRGYYMYRYGQLHAGR